MVTSLFRSLPVLFGAAVLPGAIAAQAAVDPTVAPRAAALAREGGRVQATEMLGRYLATAPDDGAAWLELGHFYLLDNRDWHRNGHQGDPPGPLFLDLAATAMDEALRLPTDSGRLLRAMVELDRSAAAIEELGWATMRAQFAALRGITPPDYVTEVGRNLVNSCPVGGVLVTGTDLEAVGVWSIVVNGRARGDVILFLPLRYGEDSLYRARMADALQIEAILPVAEALTRAANRRPVCLSPGLDSSMAPRTTLTAIRLVRVAGPPSVELPDPLSVIDLTAEWRTRPSGLARDVADVYVQAARYNQILCSSLLLPLGLRDRGVCGR